MTGGGLSVWVLTSALAGLAFPSVRQDPSSRPVSRPTVEFPTFEPFFRGIVPEFWGDPLETDAAAIAAINRMRHIVVSTASFANLVIPFFDDITLRNRRLDIEAIYVKMRPVARLGWNVNEALDPGRMLWYKSVPTIVALARRLWSVKVWSPADVKLGNAITKYLRLYGGPSWEFLTGDDSSNRLQLEAVVAWYRAEVRKTASYASMVGFPDVAYVGLSHNDPVPLSNAIVQKLDNETELRWAKVERPIEPWVVQCVHLGKPIWARVISAEPRPSVVDVMLDEASVDALGSYGWRVNFRVKWGHGRDAAFLYVGANRSFLFYVIQD